MPVEDPWNRRGHGLQDLVRAIGNLPAEVQARLFGDYLLVQGIKNEIESDSDGSWLIWVADDDHLERATNLLQQFKANPHSPEFSAKATHADQIRKEERKAEAAWRKRVRGRRQLLPGTVIFRPGPLTFALVCACVIVAARSGMGEDMDAIRGLFISYYETTGGHWFTEVKAGEFWRLFTPILVHFGLAHLLFNMLWLFRLGSMIETIHGAVRLALIMLGIAILSNVAQYLESGPGFGGMSGVNYGLFGYIWIRGKCDPASGFFVTPQDKLLMLGWLVLCFTGMVGPIANTAHAVGLLAGVTLGWLTSLWALRNR